MTRKSKKEDDEINNEIKIAEKIDKQAKKAERWIAKIEKKYSTKVIFIFGEFTDYLYEMFVRQLRKVEQLRKRGDWITIIMHSTGGDADVAAKIMDVMQNHKCKFCVVVPICASSAGAEVAMNADKLIMGKYAYLTAFDSQLSGIALKNIIGVDPDKCNTLKDYHKVIEAQYYEKMSRNELDQMFKDRYSKDVIDKLESLFLLHPTSHEHPISYDQIIETGVTHVKQRKINDWFHKIVSYYIDGQWADGFRPQFYESRVN